jgi:epoxyqueuosine reductase
VAPVDAPDAALTGEVCAVGRSAGLVAVGCTHAGPFEDTREILEQRRAEGMHGGMQFTYRNPSRSTDPTRTLETARSLVVGAWAYPSGIEATDPTGVAGRGAPGGSDETPDGSDGMPDGPPSGRVARYAADDHYGALRGALGAMADHLRAAGWQARVLADDNALVDRAAAHRAGIGWFGKSANLLVPGHGSWVVLGAVLTDAPLTPAAAPVPDGCGTCRRCLDGCPTDAIVAPGVVDARRCLAWLVQAPGVFPRQFREALGNRIYGCDDCQEVCPPNRRVPDVPAGPGSNVDLLGLLAADDDELLDRHGRWYIAGRNPAVLRRNALLALGNTADGADERVAGALTTALGHPDALVRSHAIWAARQLGRNDLLVHLVDVSDPLVADELADVGSSPADPR